MNFQPKFDSGVPLADPVVPQQDERRNRSILFRLSLVGFVTALVARAVDPIVPPIASELAVDPKSVALLSTAFALPFALVQPVLGPVADMLGKIRVMLVCLAVLLGATLVSALATDYAVLLTARIVAGVASGGIFPVGIAVIGDLVPLKGRQVAIGRWLAAVISGNLLGATLAGIINDLVGWRAVFFVFAAGGAFALITAVVTLRDAVRAHHPRFDLAGIPGRYAAVFRNPRAKVCFSAVFAEGIVIFGLFPFVALLLLAGGEARAAIAGTVLAGFSIGGIIYALTVPLLVSRWRGDQLMIGGGVVAALALSLAALELAWPLQLLAFMLLGFGFYTLHGSIQVQTTELSVHARGAAVSIHSFAFFTGHAGGPVLYGAGFSLLGAPVTIAVAAALILMVGLICARLLRERRAAP
jgi:MFS transporter, DHA1 family, inner membrane transport protein